METTIHNFLLNSIQHYHSIEPIAGDASTRRYYRIYTDKRNYILCYDHTLSDIAYENYPFKIVYDLLVSGGITVPRIISNDDNRGLLLLEDVGDNLVETYVSKVTEDKVIRVYKKIIKILVKMQSIDGSSLPFNLSFNQQKLMSEFKFFIDHTLVAFFQANLSDGDLNRIIKLFTRISEQLDRPELFVFTHRDFHSRNLIYCKKKIYIIDFQDARMGLPQYDLVSLLRDPYLELTDDNCTFLKYYYYDIARDAGIHSFNNDDFNTYFDFMAFQRNIKVLGTYGYMAVEKMNDRYVQYMRPALEYLPRYATHHTLLSDAYSLLDKYINRELLT